MLLYHELAFEPGRAAEIDPPGVRRCACGEDAGRELFLIGVAEGRVPLADAVLCSYLFNSQLVTLPDGTMALIARWSARRTPGCCALSANSSTPARRCDPLIS